MVYYRQRPDGQNVPIPDRSVKMDVERFVAQLRLQQRELTQKLINGTITPQEWYDQTTRLTKLSYRAVTDIARGTGNEMTPEEKSHWLEIMLLLLLLFNSFVDKIEAGIIPLDGNLLTAAGTLANGLNSMYQNWHLWDAKLIGRQEARRMLSPADHCHTSDTRPGCVELSELGWVDIDAVVPIGDAVCYDNCHCLLEFR